MLTQTINMEVVSFILISSVSFTTSCSQNTYVGYEPRHKAWRQGHSLTLGRGECHDQWPMLKKSKEECFTSQAVGAGCCCWPPRPHCLWECRDGVGSAPLHLGEVRGQSRLLYTEAGDAPIMTGDAPSQSCPKPPLEVWNIWNMCVSQGAALDTPLTPASPVHSGNPWCQSAHCASVYILQLLI